MAASLFYRFFSWEKMKFFPQAKKYFFLLFNIFFTYVIFFKLGGIHKMWFACYLALIASFYASIRYISFSSVHIFGLAFFLPIIWMIVTKISHWTLFVGVSYMAFRLSYLVYEVKINRVKIPSFPDYLAFSFFTPTFLMGPINPYSYFENSLNTAEKTLLSDTFIRIAVGAVKCFIFANFVNQLGFKNLWFDGYHHTIGDFFFCCAMRYLYIYLYFSGSSDMEKMAHLTCRIFKRCIFHAFPFIFIAEISSY